MKVLALVSQKGGSGKTTLALSLATEAHSRGRSVAVVDLDPQASACEWADIRAVEEPAVIDAQPARVEAVVERARGLGVELLIIDTAGRTERAALAAGRAADAAIVPLQASVVDLKTARGTLDLLRLAGAGAFGAVLMRVKPFGDRHVETARWLETEGLPVCPAVVGDRVAFQDAYARGLGVCEADPSSKAAREIREVYEYTLRLLGE